MRLVIGLCRYCLLNKDECEHREDLRRHAHKIKRPGTLCHHCPEYYKQIPVGTRARVELKEIECSRRSHDPETSEPPNAEWVSAGFADGTITDYSRVMKGFFIITLDKPATLVLPQPNGHWEDAEPTEVTVRLKRAKDVEILEGDNA